MRVRVLQTGPPTGLGPTVDPVVDPIHGHTVAPVDVLQQQMTLMMVLGPVVTNVAVIWLAIFLATLMQQLVHFALLQ